MKVSKTGYKKNSKDKNQPSLLIPSNRITMKDVEFPVLGIDNYGNQQMMYPGQEYSFPGSYVYEKPMKNWLNKYADGGSLSKYPWGGPAFDAKKIQEGIDQYNYADINSLGDLYNSITAEYNDYLAGPPEAWNEDPSMVNPEGGLNMCLDCHNVNWNSKEDVLDVARLINEGYSTGFHEPSNLELLKSKLSEYQIPEPKYKSVQLPPKKRYGGIKTFGIGGFSNGCKEGETWDPISESCLPNWVYDKQQQHRTTCPSGKCTEPPKQIEPPKQEIPSIGQDIPMDLSRGTLPEGATYLEPIFQMTNIAGEPGNQEQIGYTYRVNIPGDKYNPRNKSEVRQYLFDEKKGDKVTWDKAEPLKRDKYGGSTNWLDRYDVGGTSDCDPGYVKNWAGQCVPVRSTLVNPLGLPTSNTKTVVDNKPKKPVKPEGLDFATDIDISAPASTTYVAPTTPIPTELEMQEAFAIAQDAEKIKKDRKKYGQTITDKEAEEEARRLRYYNPGTIRAATDEEIEEMRSDGPSWRFQYESDKKAKPLIENNPQGDRTNQEWLASFKPEDQETLKYSTYASMFEPELWKQSLQGLESLGRWAYNNTGVGQIYGDVTQALLGKRLNLINTPLYTAPGYTEETARGVSPLQTLAVLGYPQRAVQGKLTGSSLLNPQPFHTYNNYHTSDVNKMNLVSSLITDPLMIPAVGALPFKAASYGLKGLGAGYRGLNNMLNASRESGLFSNTSKYNPWRFKSNNTFNTSLGSSHNAGKSMGYGFGAGDQAAIDTFENIRNRKLASWQTAEGKMRLQNMIDNTSALQGQTPELFVDRMKRLENLSKRVPEARQQLSAVEEQINAIHKNMDELDISFKNNELSQNDYFDMITSLDNQLITLGKQHDHLFNFTNKPGAGAFYMPHGMYEGTQAAFLSGVTLTPADLKNLAAHEVVGHSLSGFGDNPIVTNLDTELGNLTLKNLSDDVPLQSTNPQGISNFYYEVTGPGSQAENQRYWSTGSKGTEKVPFLQEVKEDMLSKGILTEDYGHVTPEMLEKHYAEYMATQGEKYPLRVYDMMQNDKSNFSLLSRVMNKLPSLTMPLIGTGTIGTALYNLGSTQEKKLGGTAKWLDRYQDGGEECGPGMIYHPQYGCVSSKGWLKNRDGSLYEVKSITRATPNGNRYDIYSGEYVSGMMPRITYSPKDDTLAGQAIRNKAVKDEEARVEYEKYQKEHPIPPSGAITSTLGPIEAAIAAATLGPAALSTISAAAPYVSTALNTPLAIGSTTIPGATLGNAINLGFGLHGANMLGSDIDTGYYGSDAPLVDKITRGLETGLGILGSPGVLEGMGAGYKGLKNVYNKGVQLGKNELMGQYMSRMLDRTKLPAYEEKQILTPRIDPINRSSVNVRNDLFQQYGQEQYNNLINDLYTNYRDVYDMPLIEFKSSRPSSFFTNVGAGMNDTEGILFKEKFCLPGSECAKTSNAVTNKVFNEITGTPFAVEENAHNAWHLEDQMTRHGGKNVTGEIVQGQPPRVGDRILMGNDVDQSTYVPGYIADPNVRHAGFLAGYYPNKEGNLVPMILESGANNPLFLNPISNTITGENSVRQIIRPQQFLDDTFGKGLVDKNIRYAYRNKPSVATYSSENEAAQSLLTKGEEHREKIKRMHDLTNDEFDELLNSLVAIGAQETKLNAQLPSGYLPAAKIKLQNALSDVGLTAPIKQTINLVKRTGNALTSKSSSLPKYPGTSVIEMESAKLAEAEGIPFSDALKVVKSQYQPKPKFITSTVEPSKGMFRQKFKTENARTSGLENDITNNELGHGLSQMAENYSKIKKLYPNATPRQLIDLTTLMWNSPGKAQSKQLVDFYLFGKGNPNPSKFSFDYLNKVNRYKDQLINVHPQSVEPYREVTRTGYPEIQYRQGGSTKYQDGGEDNSFDKKKGGVKTSAEGYYDYINGYKGVSLSKGGPSKKGWLEKYK